MTDTATPTPAARKFWWEVYRRPEEGDPNVWTYCCDGDEPAMDAHALGLRILSAHDVRAETAYMIKLWDNEDRTGDAVATGYHGPNTVAHFDPPPTTVLPPAAGGPPDATPDDLSDHPEHPENLTGPKILTAEQLSEHMISQILAQRDVPMGEQRSFKVLIPMADIAPEALREFLDTIAKAHQHAPKLDPDNRYAVMVAAATSLNNIILDVAKEAALGRGGSAWVQHLDMVNAVAAEASAFFYAYMLWVTSK